MLRWVIAVLVLANAGYFLWTQGHLATWGLAPPDPAEPQRLDTQIAPEALRLLNTPRTPVEPPAPAAPPAPSPETGIAPGEAPPAEAPAATEPAAPAPGPDTPSVTPISLQASAPAAPAPVTACWQAGPFTEAQAGPLQDALARLALPSGAWQFTESRVAGRWIVYMGRFENAELLDRKKAELRAKDVAYRVISTPALGPGLALGTYSTEAAAQQALRDAVRDGVRSARVAQERAESRSFGLRLPAITAAQRSAVAGLGGALAGKPLEACR